MNFEGKVLEMEMSDLFISIHFGYFKSRISMNVMIKPAEMHSMITL